MNVERVEWIADLVRYACCQQRQRIQTFRFDGLLGRAPALSDVTQNHDMPNFLRSRSPGRRPRRAALAALGVPAGVIVSGYRPTMLYPQRHYVEIDETILRVKNFHVMADWPAAFCYRFPIKASDAFRKPV